MYSYELGSLLKKERESKNISRERLREGLCTQAMLFKIEENQCDTDKLLVDVLFQRLGKSPDKLEVIMSLEEYNKIRARDMVEELMLKKKTHKALYLLEKYFSHFDETVNIHRMYYCRTKAYIFAQNGDIDHAMALIEQALEITISGWKEKSFEEYLISTYEMENLLLYGMLLHKAEMTHEAKEHTWKCDYYIREHFSDMEEYSKVYPKCVWILANICGDESDDGKIASMCEDAVSLLRKSAISYLMVPLMEEMIKRYRRMGDDMKADYWQKYDDVLREMYEEYAPDMCLDFLFFNPYQCEYHLDYEIIKGERLVRGYTQEMLIEGIYESPEPLSRIENGRTTPRRKKFDALMRKFDIEKGRYSTFLATDSFEVLEKKSEIDDCLSVYDIEGAKIRLKELEKDLDMTVADNRRFVENIRNTLERLLGEKSVDEALSVAKNLLKETYDLEKDNNRPPMRNEALLIAQIATIMIRLGKIDEATSILGKILELYRKSGINCKFRMRSYMTIFATFSKAICEKGFSEKKLSFSENGIKLLLKCGKLGSLGRFLANIGCGKTELGYEKEACKELLKKAFLLYELSFQKRNCQLIREYYEFHYNEMLKLNG